ncbi:MULTISPECIES: ABC transporter ATP-binding protein [Paenibacillus]|uniref:Amino acid ABC transporter ATPase n=2 Tax=Paenibacillus TaxID=44249 RepID=A0A0U2W347_9BACL|nr:MULTISPECIES: ABC transporter ATP-binding protein [Paenibacillus]ALS22980.1 amino acid ABC transporter ATPase [Paenibacillus naphthalenovorans]NTZ17426.1 ABC transporter ATP-binding protein [Paenibacillus sp. JMULE4]GCL71958.1 ABC transporter ATP-binding protein [Paenibacillus naphthalenovorans]SDI43615.1 branched-chain amino acid transport system ATP-binding protein [Paenibacillus naphthalenovorans]
MLALKDIYAKYDQLNVLKGISIHVEKGEVVSILGANGAGKTSVLKAITGGITVTSGKVYFGEKDVTSLPAHAVVKEGISHVPENRRVFRELSVEDNLIMGGFKFTRSKKEMDARMESVYEMFPRLRERKTQKAGTMSGGEQQMVAIGRGLMMSPKLMILDEPSQGLAPRIVEEIFEAIQKLGKEGRTIVLVEQNIFQALQISNRAYVIKSGEIMMEGDAKQLLAREDIKEAYLH